MLNKLKLIPILLIEDDEDDVAFIQKAFKKKRLANPFFIVRSGEEAIEFLKNRGVYADKSNTPRPGIILLDLNMPGMSGHQVLEYIKSDSELRSIPTIVLTGSTNEQDIIKCYDLGANTYLTKPLECSEFLDVIQIFSKYWLAYAETPDCSDCLTCIVESA